MERLTERYLAFQWHDLKVIGWAVAAGAILGGLRGWFTYEFEDV